MNHKHQCMGRISISTDHQVSFPPYMPYLYMDPLSFEPLTSAPQVVRLTTTILSAQSVNICNMFSPKVVLRLSQACHDPTGIWAQRSVSPSASLVARVSQSHQPWQWFIDEKSPLNSHFCATQPIFEHYINSRKPGLCLKYTKKSHRHSGHR